jgi:hypothetical protein
MSYLSSQQCARTMTLSFIPTSLLSGMSSTFAGPAFCAAAVDVLLVFGVPPSKLLLSENRGTSLQPQKNVNC